MKTFSIYRWVDTVFADNANPRIPIHQPKNLQCKSIQSTWMLAAQWFSMHLSKSRYTEISTKILTLERTRLNTHFPSFLSRRHMRVLRVLPNQYSHTNPEWTLAEQTPSPVSLESTQTQTSNLKSIHSHTCTLSVTSYRTWHSSTNNINPLNLICNETRFLKEKRFCNRKRIGGN